MGIGSNVLGLLLRLSIGGSVRGLPESFLLRLLGPELGLLFLCYKL
jgi:hypothetical protein